MKSVRQQIHGQTGNEIESQVRSQVRSQVWRQLCTKILDDSAEKVCDGVWQQVYNEIS